MFRGQRIQIKFWNDCFVEYSKQKDLLSDSTKPFFIVVTSTMVKEFNGKLNLCTSSSTKIYINLEVSEVVELKGILSEKLENTTIGKLDIQHTTMNAEDIASKTIDISTLMNHVQKTVEKDLIFYCKAKVTKVFGENSWYYISCPGCKRRITPRKTDFWCIPCEKKTERPIPRYRLEFGVLDHSGSTIFVIFDEEAKKLIGQDASTLFEANIYEKATSNNDDSDNDDEVQIPKIIENNIGRELLFKVKITAYNRKIKRQTFTVMKIIDPTFIEGNDKETKDKEMEDNLKDGSDSKEDTNDSSNDTSKKSKDEKVVDNKKRPHDGSDTKEDNNDSPNDTIKKAKA
ncbi:replication protein A 70 kDa DNA-binding subunit C isoform X2 [Spinacia oleracea]|uniref:Replication protein A 70 kDa DNA-binding subunit C isoform X2 n=1 Tax=Spinacia oleracea TaxID=3562 RepID=A0ABM3RLR2_SPIOL|nr:replication protein A 70 kDa DNA-binding subunit C-like isoform X2 [Spinacia oleracea]XP_056696545.1 replication protein A 70 kDa DNA-binding subunit C-like isoform X2 [Spinacia oleracea]